MIAVSLKVKRSKGQKRFSSLKVAPTVFFCQFWKYEMLTYSNIMHGFKFRLFWGIDYMHI